MKLLKLVFKNLLHFRRTNIPVILGVATAAAILTGALLVGDSVRNSLSHLFLNRLGQTDQVITSHLMFREQLAAEVTRHPNFSDFYQAACPVIALEGIAIAEATGTRASGVSVFGVDERFWKFHEIQGEEPELGRRGALLTQGLKAELGNPDSASILIRLQAPSDLPEGSLHGEKSALGRTIRLRAQEWPDKPFDFSLVPSQKPVKAVFVPIKRLQEDLDQQENINTILLKLNASEEVITPPQLELWKASFKADDLGIRIRWLEASQSISIESDSVLVSDTIAEAVSNTAENLGLETTSILTYLANSISSGGKQIPYSLVSALDSKGLMKISGDSAGTSLDLSSDSIILNDWAARDLGVAPGDRVDLEYYFWQEEGNLVTRSASFRLAEIVPLSGSAEDPDLAPVFPGLTELDDLTEWAPPFPIDLSRIRHSDENYWDQFRTTPKAFITMDAGKRLWGNRYGKVTAIRIYNDSQIDSREMLESFRSGFEQEINPFDEGVALIPIRSQGLAASKGTTDFGEYFFYFSFFLVVSALLLTGLFFRIGVEQRLKEVGILRAVGFTPEFVRRILMTEGLVLSSCGSVLGLGGAAAYAWIILYGLKTWWIDAVGTRLLDLYIFPTTAITGIFLSILAACIGILWTLHGLRKIPPRRLLAGVSVQDFAPQSTNRLVRTFGIVSFLIAILLLLSSGMGFVSQVAGFFGAGTLLMVSSFCWLWARLSRKSEGGIAGHAGIFLLGARNTSFRPGRSLLSVALVAFAVFTIISVDAFRRDEREQEIDPRSGNGGFAFLAESVLPLLWDPNSQEGREELNLVDEELGSLRFYNFRVRPGDDASCLNLYRPQQPKIIAPMTDFLDLGRFVFNSTLAESVEEKENPWILLNKVQQDGSIPFIGDANSMSYALHVKLGEEFTLNVAGDKEVRLKLVATLSDSIFQSELLISEENFVRLFPNQQGFRFFLIDNLVYGNQAIISTLEENLSDFGFDISSTVERLAGFHRVENTYLSTFQTLGGMGLILGTFGLAAVLLRNVMERRQELALLRAVGYRSIHLLIMAITENALLLAWGIVTGSICALIAIAPAMLSRGGSVSFLSFGTILLLVLACGFLSSIIAIWGVLKAPILPALRSE